MKEARLAESIADSPVLSKLWDEGKNGVAAATLLTSAARFAKNIPKLTHAGAQGALRLW